MLGPATSSLSSSVLVLNRNYLAIHIVNVRRAFTLLVRDLAEVIHVEDGQYFNHDFESWREVSMFKDAFGESGESEHEDWIQAVNFRIQVPRVIRLLWYDRLPKKNVRFNRRNIFARDKNRCQYCGQSFPTQELTLDHVKPRSQGGTACWENIVCCCIRCNVRKGGRTPAQAHMKLITEPVRPKRSPLLSIKLGNPKYESWKSFLDSAYWSVDLK